MLRGVRWSRSELFGRVAISTGTGSAFAFLRYFEGWRLSRNQSMSCSATRVARAPLSDKGSTNKRFLAFEKGTCGGEEWDGNGEVGIEGKAVDTMKHDERGGFKWLGV